MRVKVVLGDRRRYGRNGMHVAGRDLDLTLPVARLVSEHHLQPGAFEIATLWA